MPNGITRFAIAKIFGWVWQNFGKDIIKAPSKQLKTLWEGFELERAAQNYVEDMRRQYGFMQIWGMPEPIPLKNIFTQVHILGQPSAFQQGIKKQLEAIFLQCEGYGSIIEKSKDGLEIVKDKEKYPRVQC